jgi:hypothetical protein
MTEPQSSLTFTGTSKMPKVPKVKRVFEAHPGHGASLIAADGRSHKGSRDSRSVPALLLFRRELGLFTKSSIRMTFLKFIIFAVDFSIFFLQSEEKGRKRVE